MNRMSARTVNWLCLTLSAIVLWSNTVPAQELNPRAYWPAPKGTNLLVVGYQGSSGDVVTDASLPITGVEADIDFAQVTYQRTLSLLDRTANLQLNLPYTRGSVEGFAEGEFRSRQFSELADARFLISVNLRGAPTMDPSEFQALRANPRTIFGASILVQAPTGGYEPDKLINAGTNRWAVKPAIGAIWPVRPTWLLEFDLGVWIYGDNDEFLGATRKQDPIIAAEFHVVKRIRPGFWAALDFTYYAGGQTTIGGSERDDRQENSRLGGTLLFPFKGRYAIRASYSTGIVTAIGGDFDNFSLSFVYVWL
jgi:hypothetical protein